MFSRPSIKKQSSAQVRSFFWIIVGGSLLVGVISIVWDEILNAIAGAITGGAAAGIMGVFTDPASIIEVIFDPEGFLIGSLSSLGGALAVSGIILFIGGFLTIPFTLSFAQVFMNVSRGKKPQIADFFGGYKQTGKAIILQVLLNIFTTLWSILFIIPGIIKSISYSLSFYVLADHPELTALEAISVSKKLTKGHKMDIFVTYLSFIGWYLLCAIPIAGQALKFAYVTPYINTTMANIYRILSGTDINPAQEIPSDMNQTVNV
jgi:uncharacterized membrane protein